MEECKMIPEHIEKTWSNVRCPCCNHTYRMCICSVDMVQEAIDKAKHKTGGYTEDKVKAFRNEI